MTILPFPDRRREVRASRARGTAPPLAIRLMALPWIVAFAAWVSLIDALVGPEDDDYTGGYD